MMCMYYYIQYKQNNNINNFTKFKNDKYLYSENSYITISQKKFNPKSTIVVKSCLNTFSVGSIIKYFKIKQGKYIRRSSKGLKIFLNFTKNVVEKKYNNGCVLFSVVGFNYNLMNLKKQIKYFLNKSRTCVYFLFNIKISFTKTKNKKIKSIKKRLKKKILSNFLKKQN